jgi:hypothetical protein
MKKCKHKKVYATFVYTVSPPIHPWICEKCGERGQDQYFITQSPTYDEIAKRFEEAKDE